MAAGLTQADRLPPVEDFDYTKSHRPVPIPTVAYNLPVSSDTPQRSEPPGRPSTSGGEGRRRGSFSRHFRIGSREGADPDVPPLPPQPKTRIAQAQHEAADHHPPQHKAERASEDQRSRSFSFRRANANNDSSGKGGMLRKSSRMRKEEQERQAREAAAAANAIPKQPPHLPSFAQLPTIASFGGEDSRPDSVTLFNPQATHSQEYTAPRPAPANFSRPGNAAMPASSTFNSSSSPAYAYRPGNAFAQQAAVAASSSPSVGPHSSNGEYVIDPTQRAPTESITNRGRSSYASTSAPVNVNSPRRIRRRKDPTPFK